MTFRIGLAAALVAAIAGPALAQESEVLFERGHWQVAVVGWDDGSIGCVAEVSAPGEAFSVWTYPDGTAQLEFFSSNWQFGAGDFTDLEVQIDQRAPWDLAGAELYQNSIFFDLPDTAAAVDFLVEVADGTRLFLRGSDGSDVQDYSLAGSGASIQALADCGEVIRG